MSSSRTQICSSCRNPLVVFAVLLSSSVWGCKDQPNSGLPTVTMPIGGRTFTLEIVARGELRNRGLMFRDSLPDDHGMVFCFDGDEERSFWMHNTRIPLDILYVDRQGRVVSVKQMKPYVEKAVPSDGPCRYAIELNEGTAAKAGVKAGDVLQIPEVVKSTPADP